MHVLRQKVPCQQCQITIDITKIVWQHTHRKYHNYLFGDEKMTKPFRVVSQNHPPIDPRLVGYVIDPLEASICTARGESCALQIHLNPHFTDHEFEMVWNMLHHGTGITQVTLTCFEHSPESQQQALILIEALSHNRHIKSFGVDIFGADIVKEKVHQVIKRDPTILERVSFVCATENYRDEMMLMYFDIPALMEEMQKQQEFSTTCKVLMNAKSNKLDAINLCDLPADVKKYILTQAYAELGNETTLLHQMEHIKEKMRQAPFSATASASSSSTLSSAALAAAAATSSQQNPTASTLSTKAASMGRAALQLLHLKSKNENNQNQTILKLPPKRDRVNNPW